MWHNQQKTKHNNNVDIFYDNSQKLHAEIAFISGLILPKWFIMWQSKTTDVMLDSIWHITKRTQFTPMCEHPLKRFPINEMFAFGAIISCILFLRGQLITCNNCLTYCVQELLTRFSVLILTILTIFSDFISIILGQPYDCPIAREACMRDNSKLLIQIY